MLDPDFVKIEPLKAIKKLSRKQWEKKQAEEHQRYLDRLGAFIARDPELQITSGVVT
jgi:hypothetical protein